MRNLVIAVYSHPEYLPPTLNAIEFLSKEFDHIYVVHRNINGFDWTYPSNVRLLSSGKVCSVREAENKLIPFKIIDFMRFTFLLAKTIKTNKSKHLLIYDYIPALSYRLIKGYIPHPKLLWYHNHDVAEKQYIRKYSISWFAWKSENWIFPRLTIFSLPSTERMVCFPMGTLKGKFFFIPNYPAKHIYEKYNNSKRIIEDKVRILYQGSIGRLHGLEEIIGILEKKIAGRKLELVLKGFISLEYKKELLDLALKYKVKDQIIFLSPTGYAEVIKNAQTCHIGIGIHKKNDVMNTTLATASNKIYEYIACAMPVLIYDNEHFRSKLNNRNWAFFTDTTEVSILHCLEQIIKNYPKISSNSRKDFENNFSYELNMLNVIQYLRHIK